MSRRAPSGVASPRQPGPRGGAEPEAGFGEDVLKRHLAQLARMSTVLVEQCTVAGEELAESFQADGIEELGETVVAVAGLQHQLTRLQTLYDQTMREANSKGDLAQDYMESVRERIDKILMGAPAGATTNLALLQFRRRVWVRQDCPCVAYCGGRRRATRRTRCPLTWRCCRLGMMMTGMRTLSWRRPTSRSSAS